MSENLFDILNAFFNNLDFKSKKRLWYRRQNDGFIVCQFQRSRFHLEGAGYLNFGVVFTSSNGNKVPKGEDTWDLRGRYKGIIENPYLDEIFPIEIIYANDKKKLRLALTAIEQIVIPYLIKYSKFDHLINDLTNKEFDYARALTRFTPSQHGG